MARIGLRRRSRNTMPRTIVGLWLRGLMLRDPEIWRPLSPRLNGGKLGFPREEASVVHAACELAVREYWGKDYDVRDITAIVMFIREADLANGKTPYRQLEMEAVIRSALGETDVDMSGIPRTAVFEIQIVMAGFIAVKLSWSEPKINELIIEAEQAAFSRGWHPPVAT